MPQSHCRESTGDSVKMLAICAIRMWLRIIEDKNVPEVNIFVEQRANITSINAVQIANDGGPSRTKNSDLEPIQIGTGWHELKRNVVRINANKPANW